jgi:hypothetical protein
MSRFYLVIILLVLSVTVAFSQSYTRSNYQPHWVTQNQIPLECNFGFKYIATPTITITGTASVDLSDYLPEGVLGFELRAKTGAFVIGHPDNVAVGANRVGRLVSEGTTISWSALAGEFNGTILASDETSAVVVIDGAWGYGR